MFRRDFTCPALLKDVRHFTHTGLSPAMAGLSRPFCLSYEHHWPVPLSLATTDGISLMSVPPGTEMFQFPGFASYHYGFMIRYPSPGGLPHSDIHGSKPARGSPWLFAACHVLHRLLVPRHPPNALLMLRSREQQSVISDPMIGDQWISGQQTDAVPDRFHLRHDAGSGSSVPLGERSISGSFY